MIWRCGDRELDLGRTRIMGVVNVTPDSFSDGGAHATTEAAIAWGLRLLDEGADILDVGGESTRPGFTPVSLDEELARVIPVVRALAEVGAVVSIDTRHAEVARAALEAGACIINDVSGFADPAMVAVAAADSCGCIAMHAAPGFLEGEAVVSSAVPSHPEAYVDYLERDLLERAAVLERAGIAADRICLDPGPGFGTTPAQDLAVQRATERFVRLGYPYLCAVSRKRFVGVLAAANPAAARDAASVGVALAAVAQGARMVRAHAVSPCAEALRTFEACSGAAPRRKAYVALGANMGDRLASLQNAVEAIGALPTTEVTATSDVYDTEAAYLDDQPSFANAVVEVHTALHPVALLDALLAIETAAGRVRTVPNGPRVVDLDLLWMEGERRAGGRLTLPHPLMGERSFVLGPLADIVGDAEAFCRSAGMPVAPVDQRVGAITTTLGRLEA